MIMSDESPLQKQVIRDLKNDFPDIKEIENTSEGIKIVADDDLLWELFEVLYQGIENIELNASKDEKYIILKDIK